uniref:Uncharacterized protein n=1 Tax=Arion vulgaris TaxID=1028688 RepID=A0A0B6ZSK6_9EUPU
MLTAVARTNKTWSQNVQTHRPECSILGDVQVSLCDESMKRTASQMEEDTNKKAKKKRRSSLSSYRRSISGSVVSTFNIDAESGSQTSTESGSQKSLASSDDQSLQTSKPEEQRLLPNPANIKMDIITREMKVHIAKLHDECEQWKNLFVTYEEQEELAKLKAMDLTLKIADISADEKELALSEYITSKPLDLGSVKHRLDRLVLQYKFDMETCMQNLHLIQGTMDTVASFNKCLRSQLLYSTETEAQESMDNEDTGQQPGDSKQTVLNYLNYV